MAKKEKYSDHFDANFIKQVADLRKEIQGLKKDMSDIAESAKLVKASTEKTGTAFTKNKKKIDELSQAEKELEATIKEQIQTEKKLLTATAKKLNQDSEQIKKLAKLQDQIKRKNSDLRQEAKLTNAAAGSIEALRLKTSGLIKTRDRLIVSTKAERKAFVRLTKEIARNQVALIKHDEKIKRSQRKVGNYTGALNKARNAFFAISAGILAAAGIVRAIGRATQAFIKFELAMSRVAATTGIKKTSDEFKKLRKNAIDLGKSTQFTATQVSALQLEYAKLGFSTNQILAATEATLDLALATGSELALSAEVAGATLGGFGLAANETQRVVDIMAKSFSSSALDIDKWRESMKVAAPPAKAVGLTVEEVAALLGTLANAGISGSLAGTALRRTFIELNKAGITLEQGFEKVINSQDRLGTATEIVGDKAASAFLVLAEGTETTAKLTEELNKAEGAAAEMAKTMADNLAGDIELAKSAWEGFLITLGEDTGGVLREVIQGFTEFMSKLNILIEFGISNWQDYTNAVQDAGGSVDDTLMAVNANLFENSSLIRRARLGIGDYSDAVLATKSTIDGLTRRFARTSDEIKAFRDEEVIKLTEAFDDQKVVLEILFARMKSGGLITNENRKIFNQWGIGIIEVTEVVKVLDEVLDGDGGGGGLTGAIENLTEAELALKAATDGVIVTVEEQLKIALEQLNIARLLRIENAEANKGRENEAAAINKIREAEIALANARKEAEQLRSEENIDKRFADLQSLVGSTQQISDSFSTIFTSMVENRQETSDVLLEANQTELDDLNNRLNRELELRKIGAANDADIIQQKIDAKEKEKTELDRIAREQARSQTRIQRGLITANFALELSALGLAAARNPANFLSGGLVGIAQFIAQAGIATSRFVANLAALPSFAEGTPFFQGIGTGTSDSNIVRISHGERITAARDNAIINSAAGRVVSGGELTQYALAGMGFNDERLLSELQKQTGLMNNSSTERTKTGQIIYTKGKFKKVI